MLPPGDPGRRAPLRRNRGRAPRTPPETVPCQFHHAPPPHETPPRRRPGRVREPELPSYRRTAEPQGVSLFRLALLGPLQPHLRRGGSDQRQHPCGTTRQAVLDQVLLLCRSIPSVAVPVTAVQGRRRGEGAPRYEPRVCGNRTERRCRKGVPSPSATTSGDKQCPRHSLAHLRDNPPDLKERHSRFGRVCPTSESRRSPPTYCRHTSV